MSPNAPKAPLDSLFSTCQSAGMRTFLTASEFARIVQRDKKTVIRWVKKGAIAGAKRVGHIYQIPIEEVEVFQKADEYPSQLWQK